MLIHNIGDERVSENKLATSMPSLLGGAPSEVALSLLSLSQADTDGIEQFLSGTYPEKTGYKRGKYKKRLKDTKTKEKKNKKDSNSKSAGPLGLSKVDGRSTADGNGGLCC